MTWRAVDTGFRRVLVGVGALVCVSCRSTPEVPARAPKQAVISVRSGPQSLNWFTRHDATGYLVSLLTHARLVRINATTQGVEPWLAEGWTRSDDGRRYTLTLRPELRFSDGQPMTADDVVFSLAAAFDPASALSDVFTWDGQRLRAEAVDARTVRLTFPRPFGPGLRVLDALPVLPKHLLQGALEGGTFGSAWSSTTDPRQIAGLGPFVLTEHRPSERLVFERNPRYFRRDEHGAPLPRLDRLVLQILPDQDAQMLSLESGETDGSASEIRAADYATARRLAAEGRVQLFDLGAGMNPDGLWMNLRPGAFEGDPRAAWIQRDELRQAFALGVDRQQFADTVFAGAAAPVFGPVTPANRTWYVDMGQPHGPDRAAALQRLAAIGLVDRDGDGVLDDLGTRHARLTVMTQKGQASLERGAAAVRDQMRTLGLLIDVVAVDPGALVQRFLSGTGYDAVYFNLTTTDTDPASQLDFWTSDGAAHVWNLGPAHETLAWEREIDGLMSQQTASLDDSERRRLFGRVQQLFDAHAPIVYFAVPRVFVAVSGRLTNLQPAVTRPQLLWSADTIDVR